MTPRREFLGALAAGCGMLLARGAGAFEPQAGRHFRLINPPLVADAERIEVTEFFWYGCPHCFDFEPTLAQWVAKLPADVAFRRVPAIFPDGRWSPGARLYYTLEAMNLLEKFHAGVFNAIHVDRQRLDNEKVLFEWVAKKGIDPSRFGETWSSFGVQSQVQRAQATIRAAGVTGVPALMVQGLYLVPAAGTHEEMTAIVDGLVARVRAARGNR